MMQFIVCVKIPLIRNIFIADNNYSTSIMNPVVTSSGSGEQGFYIRNFVHEFPFLDLGSLGLLNINLDFCFTRLVIN